MNSIIESSACSSPLTSKENASNFFQRSHSMFLFFWGGESRHQLFVSSQKSRPNNPAFLVETARWLRDVELLHLHFWSRLLAAEGKPSTLNSAKKHVVLPCRKLTATAPENRPSQKETTLPPIMEVENGPLGD